MFLRYIISCDGISFMSKSSNAGIYGRARSRAESAEAREWEAKTNSGRQYWYEDFCSYFAFFFLWIMFSDV